MANVKISQLPSAATLTGSEEIPVVQSGATVKTTAQAIADLAGGGGGGLGTLDIIANGSLGGPNTISYNISALIPATNPLGSVELPIEAVPYININGGGGYGGPGLTATSIEFPTLTTAANFSIQSTNTLQTISAPLLSYVSGQMNFTANTAMTSLSFPSLVTVTSSIAFGQTSQPYTVSFPVLESAEINTNYNSGLTNITSVNFPAYKTARFSMYSNDLQTINLPGVTTLTSLNVQSNQPTTTINLPGVVEVTGSYIGITNLYSLTDVAIGTVGITKRWGGGSNPYVQFQNCALSQASVDSILTVLASLDGTNGTTAVNNGTLYLNGGTNAAPSSTGLTAMYALQSRGWYIQTN
jgi:hypothetical protein